MGLKAQLRRWLPLTGKATENYLSRIETHLRGVEEHLRGIATQLRSIETDTRGIQARISGLEGAIEHASSESLRRANDIFATQAAQNELQFWQLFKGQEEGLSEAKRRFFSNLPQATGSLRLAQLGHARLLAQFADLCDEHGLTYWLAYGTLLGSVRHRGFIPWDDDLDVQMPREDLQKLEEIIAGDPQNRLTVVYDRWVLCRQIRFRSSNVGDKSFVDIFPVDVIHLPSESALEFYTQHRTLLEEDLRHLDPATQQLWEDQPYLESTGEGADVIEGVFARHVKAFVEDASSGEGTEYAVHGIDNMRLQKPSNSIHRHEAIFPLATADFEGRAYTIPVDADLNLRKSYGDYWTLPADIVTHWKHVELDETDVD